MAGNQRDANERAIIEALRALGATVVQLHQPCDLLVGYQGRTYLAEVKTPKDKAQGWRAGELNASQEAFWASWQGEPIPIWRTASEALLGVGASQAQAEGTMAGIEQQKATQAARVAKRAGRVAKAG